MEFSESSHNRAEKVQEAGHLLEEAWFFGNFLDTKTKTMSRCYSDPCPSSNCNQEMLVEKSNKKIPMSSDQSVHSGLTRTPSLPTSMARGEFSPEKERFPGVKKSSSRQKLARAPSLPPCMMAREEDEDDQESEFTMGRLIRQASLSSSDMLPPPQHAKVITQSISIPRQHSRKKAEIQSKNMEGCKDRRSKNSIQNQEKIKGKSPSDIEFEELKGFKDLGLTFEKEDLNHGVVNMIPGSQEKSRVDRLGEGKLRRKQQQPYLSESWLAKSPSPPPRIPGWVDKSSAEDMKTQIKFWARAVASNVRQEC